MQVTKLGRRKKILNLKIAINSKKNGNWGVSSSIFSCKNKKKHLFFPENRKWFFLDRFYKNKWVFFSLRIGKQVGNKEGRHKKKYIESFLPKVEWVLSSKHKVLSNFGNLFDGNLLYWKSRFLPKRREGSF